MSKRAKAVAWSLCLWLAAGAGSSLRAQAAAAAPAPLALGTTAPNVVVVFGGKTRSLKSLLAGNRSAILFYPGACASCDAELQAVDKATLQQLGKLGFAVIAVSPDPPADQAVAASRLSLLYPVASDPKGAAASAFHAAGSVLYLLDRDGRVRYASNLDETPLQGAALVSAAQSLRRASRLAR